LKQNRSRIKKIGLITQIAPIKTELSKAIRMGFLKQDVLKAIANSRHKMEVILKVHLILEVSFTHLKIPKISKKWSLSEEIVNIKAI
jgi:hypothetical protein